MVWNRVLSLAAGLLLVLLVTAGAAGAQPAALPQLSLAELGRLQSVPASPGAAETIAYQVSRQRLYISNAAAKRVDIIDVSRPAEMAWLGSLDVSDIGTPSSVAVSAGLVAVSVPAVPNTDPGSVVFYDLEGKRRATVEVGANPDMLVFTRSGDRLLVANEGVPHPSGTPDPPGTVSILTLSRGISRIEQKVVGFAGVEVPPGARVATPGASFAEDAEPEHVAISPDGAFAYVTLQENNAVATIEIASGRLLRVFGLGVKDWRRTQLDASDRDGGPRFVFAPAEAYFQPDGIAAYAAGGKVYLATANEGEFREMRERPEMIRVSEATLDPDAFPDAADIQTDAYLGRLLVARHDGDTDGDGDLDRLITYGGRSFSIWEAAEGRLVYDSGNLLELAVLSANPANHNAETDAGDGTDRHSPTKGPEPETVVLGKIGARTYAFVALGASGGVAIFDVTRPDASMLVGYDAHPEMEKGVARHRPDGLAFIPALQSPTGKPLLAVAFEGVSITGIFEVGTEGAK